MAEDWIFRFLLLLFFGADGCQQRTDTDTGRAKVVYLINLQAGIDLAAAVQDFIHLIGCNGIQAAAKGIQLDQIQIILFFTKFAAAYRRE